jgi:murein L,D-transpeptidase YafK
MLKNNIVFQFLKIPLSIISLVCFGMIWNFCRYEPQLHLPTIDRIVIEKNQRKMTVYHDGKPVKEYRIALGFQPIGHKEQQGDGKTPEGLYKIVTKNAQSRFHRSLKISYPSESDRKHAAAHNVDAGNDVMIHGLMNGLGWIDHAHRLMDWTKGCVAVTSREIEEIYEATAVGTPVEIRP